MKDFGKNRQQATLVNITAQPQWLKNTIGGRDRADFLRFNLSGRSSVQATLSKLKANADLTLLNGSGQVVLQSKRKGKKNEAIATPLDAGSYYLKIAPGSPQDQTKYQLQLSGTPINAVPVPATVLTNPASALTTNAAPVLAVNTPLSLAKGTPVIFNSNLLRATDTEQNAGQLVYTLTRLPEAGLLKLNGDRLKAGGTFTQADIDAGRLVYNSLVRSQRLTTNGTNDYDPRISGFNVVWSGRGSIEGSVDYEIFFFNGSSTTQLTTNSTDDSQPEISGSNIVWSGSGGTDGGTDNEIFFFNGSTTTQLTTNNTDDSQPQISGSNIVWYGNGGTDSGTDYEVFFSNGSSTTQLTTNGSDDSQPQISGSNIVWHGSGGTDSGTDYEVFFFNGSTISQLTTNSTGDAFPQISGSNIVWYGNGGTDSGTDYEVFFSNGSTTSQLTTNNTDDAFPQISGSNVSWVGNGSTDGGTDYEIFFSNGSTTTQFTTNAIDDLAPKISGSNVVWSGNVDSTYEIFFGNLAKNDSFGFTIADGVGGATNGTFNLTLS
jgi:Cadherin-like